MPYQLGIISAISVVIPFISGLLFYRRINNDLKIFLVFLGISVVVESIVDYLSFQSKNNLLLLNIFMLIDFGFLTFKYSPIVE